MKNRYLRWIASFMFTACALIGLRSFVLAEDTDLLFSAIFQGDLRQVEALLTDHPDLIHQKSGPSQFPWIGVPPLHFVIISEQNNVEMARLLIERGADLNAVSASGESVVRTAAQLGRMDVAQMVFELGADLDLVSAAALDQTQAVESFLSKGPTTKDLNTALPLAAREGHADIVVLLLQAGADIDYADVGLGNTALHMAAERGGEVVVHALLEKGADPNQAQGNNNVTPLHLAAESGTPDMVRDLIKHGADVNAKARDVTPLIKAVWKKKEDNVRVLLEYGAEVDVVSHGWEGETPLFYAVRNTMPGIVELLLAHGADLAYRNDKGETPLHAAVCHRDLGMVTRLLDHGADAKASNNDGRTPLHMVGQCHGSVDMAKLLMEKGGADITVVDTNGLTPAEVADAWAPSVAEYLKIKGSKF